jgi:DNA-binding MarR family transcriptional regulator
VVVKGLAARGLVQRTRDPADERRLAIALTHEGRRQVRQDTVLRADALGEAMEALDGQSRAALLDGLGKLAAAAEANRARE